MNTKHILALASLALLTLGLSAGDNVIRLPQPTVEQRTVTLGQALAQRHSTREYAPTELTRQDLADLLWAANGINRPDEGKRTAPSAMNRQEVDIYVVLPEGAYRYDAVKNTLELVSSDDLRTLVADGQDFVTTAPAALVLVSDFQKLGNPSADRVRLMGAVDAGIVSQNVSLFCAAAHLATVPRGTMDATALRTALGLRDSQMPLINHPVGYFKGE